MLNSRPAKSQISRSRVFTSCAYSVLSFAKYSRSISIPFFSILYNTGISGKSSSVNTRYNFGSFLNSCRCSAYFSFSSATSNSVFCSRFNGFNKNSAWSKSQNFFPAKISAAFSAFAYIKAFTSQLKIKSSGKSSVGSPVPPSSSAFSSTLSLLSRRPSFAPLSPSNLNFRINELNSNFFSPATARSASNSKSGISLSSTGASNIIRASSRDMNASSRPATNFSRVLADAILAKFR